MKITMTTTRVDFADGSLLASGETHDLPEPLATRLIEAGQAEPVEPVRTATDRRERATRPGRETRSRA